MARPDEPNDSTLQRVASPEALREHWLAWGLSLTPEQRLAEGWRLSQRLYAGHRLDPSTEDNRLVKHTWPDE